jgi:hypothetical protein
VHPLFGSARSVLSLGIGGGGDVVGALAVADVARAAGLAARVGGVTWERRPIDPLPGPRRLEEISGIRRLNRFVALAGPETTGPGGFRFAESHMAAHLDEETVLVDPHGGPAAMAVALDDAARQLDCDLVALVDVGGDVLAHGHEPGLSSPLCDSLLLASATHMATPSVAVIFGTACDGELTPDEVLARIAEVARHGGMLGSHGLTPPEITRLEGAVAMVPTEASAMALRCGRGDYGPAQIRGGRRTVPLSPLGSILFFLDPGKAIGSAARLADLVSDAESLAEAESRLVALGIRSELAYEREMAATTAEAGPTV